MGKKLPVLGSAEEMPQFALQASLPDVVLALSQDQRAAQVRSGLDTVILTQPSAQPGTPPIIRGFVRAVLRVPLHHPQASVYGVFVEVDKQAYLQLKQGFTHKQHTEVWGTLATKLPFMDDAFGTAVQIAEEGHDARARVIAAKSPILLHGPSVGPRTV